MTESLTPTGRARVAGVVGWPIAQSLSPLIHTAWIQALGVDAVYAPFALDPELFETGLAGLAAGGVVGVNVTAPLKERAFDLADEHTPAARLAEAVNLLTHRPGGGWRGDNTDILGIKEALGGAEPTGSGHALVLGAGGAAQAGVLALSALGWRDLLIANRTEARAQALCDRLAGRVDSNICALAWESRSEGVRGAGLIANFTKLGMVGQPELALDVSAARDDAVVFDAVYAPLETPLLAAARARGLDVVNGLSMLVAQARPSFAAFYGVAPPPADVVDVEALAAGALDALRAA